MTIYYVKEKKGKLVAPSFFKRNTVDVAQELLGKIISVNGYRARIVETEAYGDDPASHAFRKTPRSQLMFDTFGHAYVYFIYGMYHCLNFTTEPKGKPGAVLIRAVEPLEGLDDKMKKMSDIRKLCSGPGKLCMALDIDKSWNGKPLGEGIQVYDDGFTPEIEKSSRIGIKDALNLEWRFFVKGNEFVSKN